MTQNPTPPVQPDAAAPTPAPRKKRRRWPWVLVGLFVVLLLLIALLPTIASTGPARSIVLGKINPLLNGHVEVASYSLGWFSPITASGVKVYDQQNRLIADLPDVKIDLTLINALRQKFALGDSSKIDVASFVLNVDDKGKTNFEELLKTEPKTETEIQTKKASEKVAGRQTKLPNVSGTIAVNFQGTVEGSGVKQPIQVEPSTALVTITDINQPIQNAVKIKYRVGDAQASTLETNGTIDAIQNNLLNIGGLTAGQKLSFGNVNLAGLTPFIKALSNSASLADIDLSGFVTGSIDVQASDGLPNSASGAIHINGLKFGGGPIGKDQFATQSIDIPVNITSQTIGGQKYYKFSDVGATMSQAQLSITGQVPEQALLNLKQYKAPGGTGSLSINATVTDLPNLAEQLRNTLHIDKDVTINSGSLTESLVVNLSNDRVTFAESFYAAAVGSRAGRPVQIQPITVNASAAAIPNGSQYPDVHDLKIAVASAFVNVGGGGQSMAKLGIKGKFDLDKMYAEAVQFVDFGKVQLRGTGDFSVDSSGDLSDENAPIAFNANANLANIKVSGLEAKSIDQDRLTLIGSGQLTRKNNQFQEIDKGYVSLAGGDVSKPLLYLEGSGIVALGDKSLPWFSVKSTVSDLAAIQKQYGGLVPQLAAQQINAAGTVYASASGTYSRDTITLSDPFMLHVGGLSVSQGGTALLSNDGIRATVAGSLSLGQNKGGTFTTLAATSDSKLFDISKTGDQPLMLELSGNDVRGSGALSINADAKRLADLAQAYRGTKRDPSAAALSSGKLDGTLSFTKTDATHIDFKGGLSNLSIVQAGKAVLSNESVQLSASGKAPAENSKGQPLEASASLNSAFATANISDAKLLPGAKSLDMLQSANVTATVPDAAKLATLISAIDPVLGTLQITSGTADIKLALARDAAKQVTSVDLTQCQFSKLALARGKRFYTFDATTPISLKLAATIETLDDKIAALKVTDLSGDLRVAALSMPKKIYVSLPAGKQPALEGAIGLKGSIASLTPLLSVLQDADPLPYAGDYAVTQDISTKDNLTSLGGTVDVNRLQVIDPETHKATFSEDVVSVRDDLDVDLSAHNASVKTFTVDMPKSQALGVKFKGKVSDWANACMIGGIDAPAAQLDLTYDAAKLWQIAQPMLSAEMQTQYKDLKIAGKYTKSFQLSGPYDTKPNLSATQRLAKLNAKGALSLDLLDLPQGLTIKAFELPFVVEKGALRTQAAADSSTRQLSAGADGKASAAKTALCNDGALNLDGMAIDLNYADPQLSIERKHVLLHNVALNSVLADSIGHGNLLFKDADQASGLLDVQIVDCKRVPLGDLITKKQNATAQIVFSVKNLVLDGAVTQTLGKVLNLGDQGITGNINNGTITLWNGRVDSNFAVDLTQNQKVKRSAEQGGNTTVTNQVPLAFGGGVILASGALKDFAVNIPSELIPSQYLGKVDIAKLLPNGLVVPFTGSVSKYKFDFQGAISKSVGNSLLGGNGDPQDALKNLGDLLGGGKKKKNRDRDDR